MSDAVLQLVARIEERLGRLRRRIYGADLAAGAAWATAGTAGLALALLVLESLYWFDPEVRSALLVGAFAVVFAGWAFLTGRPLLQLAGWTRRMSLQDLARRLGERFPRISDRLVNLLQLAHGEGSIGDEELREHAVASLAESVEQVRFEDLGPFERARIPLRWAGLGVGLLALAFLTAPSSMSGALHRLAHPGAAFERPAPFSWTVAPGDTTVVRGESMRIRARAEGSQLPREARLLTQMEGASEPEVHPLEADTAGRFAYEIPQIRSSTRYRIEAGRVESRWHRANLVTRPMVRRLQVRLTPPSYTDLPARTLPPNVGDVSALPGTRAEVRVETDSTRVRRAVLEFENGGSDTLSLEQGSAAGSFVVRRPDTYRVRLQSPEGIANAHPIDYRVQVLSDEAPTIQQLAPGRSTDISSSTSTDLRLQIADDYGFRRMQLFYRLSESRFDAPMEEFRSISIPVEEPRRLNQVIEYTWALSETTELDPVRGDVIEYYVQIEDNNRVAGFQSARTPTHTLRVPSLAEEYEQLEQTQDSASTALESIRNQTDRLHEQFERMRREIRRSRETGWENQQQVESLRKQQEAVGRQVEQLQEQVQSMTRQMEQKDLVSEETLQKYRELQKVVEEIESPELQKALQEMRQAMENLDFEQLQQAMEEFSFNEEDYRERIERTLDLFERMKAEQNLDEASRRAQNLAERQQELARQTEQLRAQLDRMKQQAEGRSEQEEAEGGPEEAENADRGGEQETAEADSDEETAESGAKGDDSEAGADGETEESGSDEERGENASGESETDPSGEQEGNRSSEADAPSPSRESLAEEQGQSQKLMEELEQQLREMEQQMSEMQSAPGEELQKLREKLQQQELPGQMKQNRQQLQQGDLNEAQQGQKSMQKQLQQLSQQLQNMKSSMQSQQLQISRRAVRRTLENTLVLSRDQEQLRGKLSGLSTDSPALRDVARTQNGIAEGVRTVADSLQQLSRNIPQMSRQVQQVAGEALRAMNRSMETVQERDLSEAGAQQRQAMQELNRLAGMLAQLLEQLDNMQGSGGSGGSMAQMMKQIQQMAGQQQKLNKQLQQFLNSVQGNRLSQGQQERLQQMKRQQEAIRRQLQEMRQQGGDMADELLGELDRVAKQMEESIAEMRDQRLDRNTVDRQRQILSRLLQAQQSMRTRGQSDERRGRTGEDVSREGPGPLPEQEESQEERLRQDLIRALESGYAPDYEELIKRYFRQLEESEQQ